MPGNDIEKALGHAFTIADIPLIKPAAIQLQQAMQSHGIEPPDELIFDGNIHRFQLGKSKDAGWYVIFDEGITAGAYGNWQENSSHDWCAKMARPLDMLESAKLKAIYKESKKKREEERAKRAEVAAISSGRIWDDATAATPDHPYLQSKHVQPHGARVTGDGRLIIPLYVDGKLSSLEYITSDGDKSYHSGSAIKGAFHILGQEETPKRIYFAEGFSTAASIYETTHTMTVICYSANGLEPVTKSFRERYPHATFIIVADNDVSETGEREARKAAAVSGSQVILVPVVGMDANDYETSGHDLAALLGVKKSDWLEPMSSLVSQPSPVRWLIKRWIPAESFIMVHGQAASGKSFIVMDWCLRMTYDMPWQGHKTAHGNVVYLAGEGHNGLKKRIAGWLAYYGKEADDSFHMSKSGTNLDKPEGLQHAIDAVRSLDTAPDIIVVDTLHRFYTGNENDAKDAGEMIRSCAMLMQEFKCSVLLVHHTGVSAEAQHRGRGSSAWRAALDVEVSLAKKDRDIIATCSKMKDEEEPSPEYLALESITVPGWFNEEGEPETTAIVLKGEKPKIESETSQEQKGAESFRLAWEATGRDTIDGAPYVTISAWSELLVNMDDMKESSAKKALQPGEDRKPVFIQTMVKAKLIERYGAGFIAVNGLAISLKS